MTEEMIQRVVDFVWAPRLEFAGKANSISRH
jgi:hypothetical protein